MRRTSLLFSALIFGTAPDELDYFKAVVGLHLRRLPLGTRENFAVALDGDAIGPHLQDVEQGGDGQAIWDFAAVSIDDDLHTIEPCQKSNG
jgi:hypothetical protein